MKTGQIVYGREFKPIEDIRVGDFVLTHAGRLKRVTRIYKRPYNGDIITFSISGGPPISVTPDHQMLVRMPVSKNKQTSIGMELVLSSCTWRTAREIANEYLNHKLIKYCYKRRKYRVIFSAPKPDSHIVKHLELGEYYLKLNKELARLIGYYVADGSASGRYLEFSFSDSTPEYAEDVLNICNNELGFLKSQEKDRRHGSINKDKTAKAVAVKYHVGKKFAELWRNWLGKNSHEKHIPYEILYNADLDICKEFKIGIWNGDGDRHGNLYATVSTQLAYGVQLLLGRLDIYSRVTWKKPRKSGYKGSRIYHVEPFRSNIAYHVKKTGHIILSNKKEYRGKFYYRPIRGIEIDHYEGDVYNLEVEGDKTYQVNAVSVQNQLTDWGEDNT